MSAEERTEVDAVISGLFDVLGSLPRGRHDRSITRLDDDVVVLDVSGYDHTLEVIVERVPRRRWEPPTPVRVGRVDGLDLALVAVEVASFVTVHLVAEPSTERDRLAREYDEAFERWALTAKERRDEPPEPPSHVLTQVAITLEDPVGTAYARHSMRHGGTGTEWDASWRYRPRPPEGIRALDVTAQVPGGAPVTVRASWDSA